MAITLQKNLTIKTLVNERLQEFVVSRNTARALKESDFYRKVLDEGLKTEDQLAYRKKQIEEEKGRNIPDNSFVDEIKSEISTLKNLVRAEKFKEEYLLSFEDLKTSRKNIDDHIAFLERQADQSVDASLKMQIQEKLSEARIAKFDLNNATIENRAKYALEDRTAGLLQKSIDEISQKRAESILVGDEALLAKWDSHLLSLRSQLQSTKIEDIFNAFQVDNLSNPKKAVDMLDFFESNIKNASMDNVPLFMNGTRYNSTKEFWQDKAGQFIQNSFFDYYASEINEKNSNASMTLSPVLESQIRKNNEEINKLMNHQILIPYADRLESLKTATNYSAVKMLGSKILEDYNRGFLGTTSEENYSMARNKLLELNRDYNVDVTDAVNWITESMASKKEAIASNLIQETGAKMQEGYSFEEALKRSKAEVPAIDIPSSVMAERAPEQTVKEIYGSATGQKSPYDIGTTAQSPSVKEEPRSVEPVKITPTVQAPAPTIPQGYEKISGALYSTREAQQAAYSNIQQVGNIGESGSYLIGMKKT